MKRLLTSFAIYLSTSVVAAANCLPEQLDIKGDFGLARFNVEVVDTPQTRAIGLMSRPKMARSSGMLFVYDRPQPVAFWMKNTLIPLDMIFAGPKGKVRHIHENAIPHDETSILGGARIQYVLEINGGLAKSMGINEGSMLRHPSLNQDRAAWPCE